MTLPPIDFGRLAQALLDASERYCSEWLPGGRVDGHEYVCADLSGGRGTSLSINLNTGAWADFANPDDKGGDLISLYAAIHGIGQAKAARELMNALGWSQPSEQTSAHRHAPASAPDDRPEPPPWDDAPQGDAQAPAESRGKPAGRPESIWQAIVPVPAHASAPNFKHFKRGFPDATWVYERDGQVFGYVCRYTTSDGGKDILPHTWCQDLADGRGLQRWQFRQWDEPRPLYLAAGLLASDPALVPVVLVEGEKCAQAGHALSLIHI